MITDGSSVITNPTVIDNRGQVLLVEYSSRCCCWEGLAYGQRAVYRAMVEAGRGRIVAALAKHPDVAVVDGTDVVAFQTMAWDSEQEAVR
jgi:hypothetical protein